MGRRGGDLAPGTDPGETAMLGWALVCGTVLASPLLVAAAQGHRDLGSTLTTWGLLLVVSWLGCNLVGGLLDALDPGRRFVEADPDDEGATPTATSAPPTSPTPPAVSVDDLAATVDDDADVTTPGGGGHGG